MHFLKRIKGASYKTLFKVWNIVVVYNELDLKMDPLKTLKRGDAFH